MSAYLDSTAHFEQRCKAYGLTAQSITRLAAIGVKTLGQVAHIVGVPGQDIQDSQMREWIDANLSDLSVGEVLSFKRLHLSTDDAHCAIETKCCGPCCRK